MAGYVAKDFLAGYVADSTENKYVPISTKHLPALMTLMISVTYKVTYNLCTTYSYVYMYTVNFNTEIIHYTDIVLLKLSKPTIKYLYGIIKLCSCYRNI